METKTFRHQARFTRSKFVHNKDFNVQVVNKDFKIVKKKLYGSLLVTEAF